MSSRNWISDLFKRNNWSSEKQDAHKLRRRKRQLLKIETLESRVVPAGGLTAEFNAGAFRLGNTSENISLIPLTPNDQETLNKFFITTPDGSAASVNVHGTFNIAGTKISGALNLREVNGQGVEMVVAEGAVKLGQTVGISLKDAFGAFVVRNTGSAGVITSEDASDGTGVDIVGIKGLKLDSLDKGVTLAINTSGEAVSRDISTALGSISISFSDGKDVKQISGPADIQVSGPQGTVFRIGSQLTATETLEGLNLRTDQVTVDLYAGTKRAVSLGAASANFSLTSTGLALVDNSFPSVRFHPSPQAGPSRPGRATIRKQPWRSAQISDH
ncbi:MAG: hypothetical protein U0798_11455 [Gemmataceae bacterium]